jgi:hypothetical protein
MSPFGKDETGHASPVGTILPFTLHVTGSIPHGDIHTSLEGVRVWRGAMRICAGMRSGLGGRLISYDFHLL